MKRIGLLGYGYWGPNLARNIARNPDLELTRIVDIDPRRLVQAKKDHPGTALSVEPEDATQADDIDAVVIATPICTHYELALDALRHDKHVLAEKPMADSVKRSEHLIEEAARRKLLLMVDHTFAYTQTVAWIQEFIASGNLGDLYYFDAVRSNLGLFQHDASVIWDLAPHDLSILFSTLTPNSSKVHSVSATGSCHAGSRVPNIAYLSLELDNGAIAHIHVNWLSPVKLRRVMIAGSKQMIIFDDMENSEKIKIYDTGVSIEHQDEAGQHRMLVNYRSGDMRSPAIGHKEALQTEMAHFAACLNGEAKPICDGEAGLAVVRICEAAQCSLQRGGERIAL